MDWLIYALLGIVQGITEWLPISSSGHLVIIENLFHVKSQDLTFEVFLNFATFLALIVVFRRELYHLIVGFFRYIFKKKEEDRPHFSFAIYLIVGSIPVGVLGLIFQKYIENNFKTLTTVSLSLIITGLGLYVISKITGHRKELNMKDAIWVGLFQAVALVPGISRSGATIFASLYRKLDKELAIRYSFFLAIPVSLGTMLLKVKDLGHLSSTVFVDYSLAFVVAFVSAIFAIKWFIGILNKGKLIYFTYYCLIVGSVVFLYSIFF